MPTQFYLFSEIGRDVRLWVHLDDMRVVDTLNDPLRQIDSPTHHARVSLTERRLGEAPIRHSLRLSKVE